LSELHFCLLFELIGGRGKAPEYSALVKPDLASFAPNRAMSLAQVIFQRKNNSVESLTVSVSLAATRCCCGAVSLALAG
jgi:hypothetical protein